MRDERLEDLRSIVEMRRVCFDAFPERIAFPDAEAPRAVGYELVLSGIHTQGTHPPQPGCELCKEVYEDMSRIARWILPEEHRVSVYEIEPYRAVIRATRKRRLREEVTLTVRILHRDHYEAPVDECEKRCLVEMKEKLLQIGAGEGDWR